jgi:hypothetical protein
MLTDQEARLAAIAIAGRIADSGDPAGSVLAHAQWFFGYIKTGQQPEVETAG